MEIEVDESELDRKSSVVTSYAPVFKSVTPTVVSVYATNIETPGSASSQQDLMERFFGAPRQQRPQSQETPGEPRRVPQGAGSAVIITSDGYIVSNNHVVTGGSENVADEIVVRLDDNQEFNAKVVGRDAKTDIAVLKIEAKGLPAITLADSDKVQVGDIVFAIGNPLGVGKTVTSGIVSAVDRAIGITGEGGYESFIQTDASINPGNSGGALIDAQGRLIGINSAILSQSGGADGIGFAVSSNLAKNIAKQLVEYGEVRRGYLGVAITNVTADIAEAFQLPNSAGALINEVHANSPAEKSGLKKGDVIIEINGKKTADANSVRLAVSQNRPGTDIKFAYLRDGKRYEATTKIVELDSLTSLSPDELLEGVTARPIRAEDRQQNGTEPHIQGLLITEVTPDSPYARSLFPGMVISEINDQELNNIATAKEAFQKGVNKLYVYYRNLGGYLVLRI
ncbi:MAG: Do family serine endopeptidase [Verrucomicrobiae bacterium]|nr:Do family serine endopeptidase [Verrucomicrobiae bacterium]